MFPYHYFFLRVLIAAAAAVLSGWLFEVDAQRSNHLLKNTLFAGSLITAFHPCTTHGPRWSKGNDSRKLIRFDSNSGCAVTSTLNPSIPGGCVSNEPLLIIRSRTSSNTCAVSGGASSLSLEFIAWTVILGPSSCSATATNFPNAELPPK